MLHGANDQPCGAALLQGLTKRRVIGIVGAIGAIGVVGVGGRSGVTEAGQYTRHRVLPQQRQTELAQISRHPRCDTGADPLMIRVCTPVHKGHNGDDTFELQSRLVINLTGGLHVATVWEGAKE